MRRKPGTLLPIELSVLEAGLALRLRGESRFHGFLLAKVIREQSGARLLTAHGTLYRALDRMAKAGLLESEWEDPLLAAEDGRPRRRLYQVTAVGEATLAAGTIAQPPTLGSPYLAPKAHRGLAPS